MSINLIDCMSKQFAAAKSYWRVIYLIQAAILILAIYQVVVPGSTKLILITGSMSLLGPIAVYLLKNQASSCYSAGERIRRFYAIEEGLGIKLSESEARLLLVDSPGIICNFEPQNRGTYYATTQQIGPKRLLEILQESAFYTRKLADISRYIYGVVVCFGLAFTAISAFGLISEAASLPAAQSIKVVTVLIVFFASGMFVSQYSSYASLYSTAHAVYGKAGVLAQKEPLELASVFLLMDEYDSALAKAPPLPGVLHWMKRDKIEKAWKPE